MFFERLEFGDIVFALTKQRDQHARLLKLVEKVDQIASGEANPSLSLEGRVTDIRNAIGEELRSMGYRFW